ncbi:hypothetical protein BpHYR1_043300 [Brachionus plicatilis]|uniref:Uncharacterized protein n=1 Tax=Brachionus plicatilis TaxID=10195 RepID=A0A3M7QHX1_BRAPC|nr:hypothetical protein BpHYR1_043300 [Brachionus plicatilis]
MSLIASNILSVKSIQDKIKQCDGPKSSKANFNFSKSMQKNTHSELFFTFRVSSLLDMNQKAIFVVQIKMIASNIIVDDSQKRNKYDLRECSQIVLREF